MSAARTHPQSGPGATGIAVIGLGYVGLPVAVALARTGAGTVLGFDIDPARVAALQEGEDATGEVDRGSLLTSGLRVTDDPAELPGTDTYIVTVPTPVDERKRPDLGPLLGACRTVGEAVGRSSPAARPPLVVFESTVYPGVTENICGPALEAASGRRAGHDFVLGYSPERINPGDREHTVDRIAKVVAGQDEDVTARLQRLYGRITNGGIFVARDIRTAEAAKAIENAQRDLNIAFVNEVAMICGRLGMSIYDVIEAARTKWNFLDFRPGLVGGHCIGIDPYYLAHCAQEAGHHPEIVLAGRRINDAMGDYFAGRIATDLQNRRSDSDFGVPRTLVLGLTFKEDLPDLRNSKVVDLVRGLEARGHRVAVHDPRADPAMAEQLYGIRLEPHLGGDGAEPYDCLVGAVAHRPYREFTAESFARLVRPGGMAADIKGMWRQTHLPPGIHRWQL